MTAADATPLGSSHEPLPGSPPSRPSSSPGWSGPSATARSDKRHPRTLSQRDGQAAPRNRTGQWSRGGQRRRRAYAVGRVGQLGPRSSNLVLRYYWVNNADDGPRSASPWPCAEAVTPVNVMGASPADASRARRQPSRCVGRISGPTAKPMRWITNLLWVAFSTREALTSRTSPKRGHPDG